MMAEADQQAQSLWQYVAQHSLLDPEKWLQACVRCHALPIQSIVDLHQTALPTASIPLSFLKSKLLLPLAQDEKKLIVGIANPMLLRAQKIISQQVGCDIEFRWMRYDHLCRLQNHLINQLEYALWKTEEALTAQKIMHHLLSDAIHRNVSDIHIEPGAHRVRVRFRIDGLLQEIIHLPKKYADTLMSCIKVTAHLDIAIKRTPQDGRLMARSYRGWVRDCRVSSYPTQQGEKIVMRLLETHAQQRSIHELGLTPADQHILLKTIAQPQGLILITGPTGSGKTITLYTLLHLLNQPHRNIVTLEDPIEITLAGVNQTTVAPKSGITFSAMLRALLRQDPDVMMIGEIRDEETADIAIRAAQTGHLVLSTLHTNSAREAITRLQHMKIATYQMAAALRLVVAQRLVRKLCVHCATAAIFPKKTLEMAGFSQKTCQALILKKPRGCEHCTGGYQGRIGVFELLVMDASTKTHLLRDGLLPTHDNLLWSAGLACVKAGITSLDEMYRVIPREEI